MKTFSRRKFVETAVISGVGVTLLSDIAKARDSNEGINNIISPSTSESISSQAAESKIIDVNQSIQGTLQSEFKTMRPIRKKQGIMVTVGQTEGDFQGTDDKILQAAVDYV
jgi:hypothetical protein